MDWSSLMYEKAMGAVDAYNAALLRVEKALDALKGLGGLATLTL